MFRSAVRKVMWVGRATVFLVGLAVILALLFGAATTALAHSGVDTKLFHLGHSNSATAPTSLISSLTDAAKSALIVNNKSGGAALDLRVTDPDTTDPALKDVAPMKVNSQATVTNLNADELDGKTSSAFWSGQTYRKSVDATISSNQASGTERCDSGEDVALGGGYDVDPNSKITQTEISRDHYRVDWYGPNFSDSDVQGGTVHVLCADFAPLHHEIQPL